MVSIPLFRSKIECLEERFFTKICYILQFYYNKTTDSAEAHKLRYFFT